MPEKIHYCLICKHKAGNEEISRAGTKEVLYLLNGNTYGLHLCYLHSIEYFIKGQVNFLIKYNRLIDDFCRQVDDPVRTYLDRLESSLDVRKKSPWWKGDWFE